MGQIHKSIQDCKASGKLLAGVDTHRELEHRLLHLNWPHFRVSWKRLLHPCVHLRHWSVEVHLTSAYFLPLLVGSRITSPGANTIAIYLKFRKTNPTYVLQCLCGSGVPGSAVLLGLVAKSYFFSGYIA